MAEKLYIIDGFSQIYAAHYAPMRGKLTSAAGEPTKAAYIFATALVSLLENERPDMLAVAMDSKEPSFRTKIYPEYKAHRPPMPEELPPQLRRIEQILAAMNIGVFRVGGYEADDIIGTLVKKARKKGFECFICSRDKDMYQLVNDHVSILNIKTGQKSDRKSMLAEMGVTPEQFIDCLALAGDTADNVPGVPDVGPKTALSWIKQYGSIENLLKNAGRLKGKRGENLRNAAETLLLSKRLVTIDCDVPVKFDSKQLKLNPLKADQKEKLSSIFSELGFTRLLSKLGLPQKTTEGITRAPLNSQLDLSHRQASFEFHKPACSETIEHKYHLIDTPQKFSGFLKKLKKFACGGAGFAIDTETTSINPMSAELVGMSFSWEPHTGYYLPVKAPPGDKQLDIDEIRPELTPIFADAAVKKIGQNIKYDLLVLLNAQMPLKGVFFDTMVASYCLEPQRASHSMDKMALDFLNYQCIPISSLIGKGKKQVSFDMVETRPACEYAAEDADITLQLYRHLKHRLDLEEELKSLFETVEMPLVSVLAEMEHNGVWLDTSVLKSMSGELDARVKSLTDEIYSLAGSAFNIDSPKQLGAILFEKLKLPSVRVGKSLPSTDAAVLEELEDRHPVIPAILEYRRLVKLKNTYVDKLPGLINPDTGRLHASFNQAITATGRLSSSRPNLQNIPIRTQLGKKIRAAFIPESSSDYILSADYSQIELRLLAHLSKDEALLEAFARHRDIHSFVASQIYNVGIEEVTPQMRASCKAVNFGIIYGQSAFGLAQTTGMTRAQAQRFIDDYFRRYRSIGDFTEDCAARARRTGYAETILHRRRKIENLNSKSSSKRSQARRLAVNSVIQGSAADLIKVAMVNIHKKIRRENLPVKLILQIHDELVFELPAHDAARHAEWISDEMTSAIELDVPVKVDISYGPSWLGEK